MSDDLISGYKGAILQSQKPYGSDGKFRRPRDLRQPPVKISHLQNAAGDVFSLIAEKLTPQIADELLESEFLKNAPNALKNLKEALTSISNKKPLSPEEHAALTFRFPIEPESTGAGGPPYKYSGQWTARFKFERLAHKHNAVEYHGALRG